MQWDTVFLKNVMEVNYSMYIMPFMNLRYSMILAQLFHIVNLKMIIMNWKVIDLDII